MAFKVFLLLLAVAHAFEYPDGIDPELCPNYPYCNNELLAKMAVNTRAVYLQNEMPVAWPYLPYYGRLVYNNPALIREIVPKSIPVPDKYPADFDASKCPNYPTCD